MKNPFRKTDESRLGKVIRRDEVVFDDFGEVIGKDEVVFAPNADHVHYTQQSELIAKLNKVAPFLAMLRDKGMTYKQISEILEMLTGISIKPDRVKRYIVKINPPTIHITITDRDDDVH